MWVEFLIRFHFGLNSWSSVRVCERGMGQLLMWRIKVSAREIEERVFEL